MDLLSNLVRVGTVSSVNSEKRTARVIFKSLDNMVSGELIVLQHNNAGVAVDIEDTTLAYGVETKDHNHEASANVMYWMPTIGQSVLCIYEPVFNGAGFILGGL